MEWGMEMFWMVLFFSFAILGAIYQGRRHKLACKSEKEKRREAEARIAALQTQVHEWEKRYLVLESKQKHEEQLGRERQLEQQRWADGLESRFKDLASRVLEASSDRWVLRQESEMKKVVEPFQEALSQFRQELEVKSQMESRDRVALKEQVRLMMELNGSLSEQANHLTRAIRGEFRTQGAWGEVVLLGILERMGLQKDIHYIPQFEARSEDGKRMRPDVLVRLPQGRVILIDAKVSLVAYERYGLAEGEDQSRHAKDLIRSLKKHIEDLGSRSYGEIHDSLDFVLLFVPVEPAYMLAMEKDPELWHYAYQRKVLMVSPTNLVATLRLVHELWQKDALHREAGLMGQKVAGLYEKLVGFVENMDKLGQQLDRARDTWDLAYRQLYTGKGNLIARAEQLARPATSRSLPDSLVSRALEHSPPDEKDT